MPLKLIILILIVPCESKIKINITTASTKQYVLVSYNGFDNKIITDREVALFNITKENLNKGLRVELGKAPDDVFLKDPTPYYNLYEQFKWPQVERHMVIKRATVLDVIHQQVIVKTEQYINNSTIVQKCKKSFMEDVEFTVFSFWSKEGFPNDDIKYDVCIDFATKKHCFTNKWRDSTFESITESFGANLDGSVDIQPGQTIVRQLIANKTIIFVEFEYSATLIGCVIADYDYLYGKYHFYAPMVDTIMRAGNLNNEIMTTERIEIRGYTDPKVVIYDKDTGKEIRLSRRIKLVGGKKNKKIVVY